MTIGDFSRATRLSAAALRFYHRVGVLEPAAVDPVDGYRLYEPDQIVDAQVVRQLRALSVTVDTVREILAATATPALVVRQSIRLDDLGAWFALREGPDKSRVVEVFTLDAVVVDDGRTYRGRDAVRTWLAGPASEFTTTSTRLAVEQAGATATVVVLLEGDFPGGRVELTQTFELEPDGLVRALSISA